MRKFVSITLVLIFSLIYYKSTEEISISEIPQSMKSKILSFLPQNATDKTDLQNKTGAASGEDSPEDGGEGSAAGANTTGLENLNETQLSQWVVQQSSRMNSTENNTEELTKTYRQLAATLRPEQRKHLVTLSLNPNLPVNERILSAYILTLNEAPEAYVEKIELAQSELPDLGPILPHSEAELKRSQELALRYMQVDALASLAKTDANARDKLKLLTVEARSEEVRKYALEKLQQLEK